MRVFILDDLRTVDEAIASANLVAERSVAAWWQSCAFTVARAISSAKDAVLRYAPFDLWILDNDLGVNRSGQKEEGYTFLLEAMTQFPERIPNRVVSCSANGQRRDQIVGLFDNWVQNGRQSPLPIGVE